MKAEELANNAKVQISDDDFVYTFHPDEFDKFCNQFKKEVCKKQRHICQVEMDKDSICIDGKWYILCNDILNAPEPD